MAHAREAGLLLRVSDDRFLPVLAELLRYELDRHDRDLYKNGWDLVIRMRGCARELRVHRPYYLRAALEAVKASVYLRQKGKEPPSQSVDLPTIEEAIVELDAIIGEARALRLRISTHTLSW